MALLIANKFKSKEDLDSLQVTSTPFCPEQATDGIPSSIIDSWWKNRGKETTQEKKNHKRTPKTLVKILLLREKQILPTDSVTDQKIPTDLEVPHFPYKQIISFWKTDSWLWVCLLNILHKLLHWRRKQKGEVLDKKAHLLKCVHIFLLSCKTGMRWRNYVNATPVTLLICVGIAATYRWQNVQVCSEYWIYIPPNLTSQRFRLRMQWVSEALCDKLGKNKC